MRDSIAAMWLVMFLWQLQSSISPRLCRHIALLLLPLFLSSFSLSPPQSLILLSVRDRETRRKGITFHQESAPSHTRKHVNGQWEKEHTIYSIYTQTHRLCNSTWKIPSLVKANLQIQTTNQTRKGSSSRVNHRNNMSFLMAWSRSN